MTHERLVIWHGLACVSQNDFPARTASALSMENLPSDRAPGVTHAGERIVVLARVHQAPITYPNVPPLYCRHQASEGLAEHAPGVTHVRPSINEGLPTYPSVPGQRSQRQSPVRSLKARPNVYEV